MFELVKRLLRLALGEYQFWKVFSIDLPQPEVTLPTGLEVRRITASDLVGLPDAGLRDRASFDGNEALGFGLFEGGELVCVQWYWWGARYQLERSGRSWRIPEGSAKSVGLYTVEARRGQGYAAILKRQSAFLMSEKGFHRLYSRIWHSHRYSIRVSKKAGWKVVGSYIEISPLGKRIEMRIPL